MDEGTGRQDMYSCRLASRRPPAPPGIAAMPTDSDNCLITSAPGRRLPGRLLLPRLTQNEW
jgi:hypothetical protein